MSVVLDLPKALLFAYGECGPQVTEAEFHDWYDNEHAPARLTVKGFSSAARYKAVDGLDPAWLALFDMTSPEVMLTDEYKSLRANVSKREVDIVSRLQSLDRRVYTQISTLAHPTTSPSSLPGKYVLVVSMEPTVEGETEFNKWYEEEHMGLLSKTPGWLRGRRYKLVNQTELAGNADKSKDAAIPYLAIHEWDRPDFAELPEYKHARGTPWRAEVYKTVVRREYRVFELYRNFSKSK